MGGRLSEKRTGGVLHSVGAHSVRPPVFYFGKHSRRKQTYALSTDKQPVFSFILYSGKGVSVMAKSVRPERLTILPETEMQS